MRDEPGERMCRRHRPQPCGTRAFLGSWDGRDPRSRGSGLAAYAFELGVLKNLRRTGWAQGNAGLDGWITSSRDDLTTDTARRIAAAAEHTSPLAWRGR